MDDKLLALILDYKMTKMEAKAWKVAIMYIQLAKEYFPNDKPYRLGKKDPRKTILFRHCYKLVRESHDLLADHEYRLYITAQLQILKNIECGDCHANLSPNCLVGPKAWKRWLVWKRRFERKSIVQSEEDAGVKTHQVTKIVDELKRGKKFLESKFSELNKKSILDSLNNRALFRWTALGQLSPYYLAISPTVKQWAQSTNTNLLDKFAIDLNYYRSGITQEIENYFRCEFAYDA